jgi:hypothetical protein
MQHLATKVSISSSIQTLTIQASYAIISILQYPSFVRANTVSEFSQVLFASFFANGTFYFCHLHYINTSQ